MSKKDQTEIGITGKPVPKPTTAKKQYELEKKRRMQKHLGKNVGGIQYSSDVNPYYNPRQRTFEEFMSIVEEKQGPSTPVKHDPKMGVVPDQGATRIGKVRLKKELKEGKKNKNIPPNAVPGTYEENPDGSKSYTLKPTKPLKKPLSKKEIFNLLAKQGGIGAKAIQKAQKNK
jgi:hypothetical protein